jgi:hypothetical protein
MICMRYQVYFNAVYRRTRRTCPRRIVWYHEMEMLTLHKKKAELHDPSSRSTSRSPTLSRQTTALGLPPVNGITKLRLVLKCTNMPRGFNSHWPVGMDLLISHSLPHLRQKHSCILYTPPMAPRQRRHSNCFKSTRKVLITPSTKLFILLILRP